MDEKMGKKTAANPRFIPLKEAAAETGFPEYYLRQLYLFPGQKFAVKRDPRKARSRIYYNMDAFYKWLEKSNERTVKSVRR